MWSVGQGQGSGARVADAAITWHSATAAAAHRSLPNTTMHSRRAGHRRSASHPCGAHLAACRVELQPADLAGHAVQQAAPRLQLLWQGGGGSGAVAAGGAATTASCCCCRLGCPHLPQQLVNLGHDMRGILHQFQQRTGSCHRLAPRQPAGQLLCLASHAAPGRLQLALQHRTNTHPTQLQACKQAGSLSVSITGDQAGHRASLRQAAIAAQAAHRRAQHPEARQPLAAAASSSAA